MLCWIGQQRFRSAEIRCINIDYQGNAEFQEQFLQNIALKSFVIINNVIRHSAVLEKHAAREQKLCLGCAAQMSRTVLHRIMQNCCSWRACTKGYQVDETARSHGHRTVPLPLEWAQVKSCAAEDITVLKLRASRDCLTRPQTASTLQFGRIVPDTWRPCRNRILRRKSSRRDG
jgi:hypothetical protein